MITIPKAKRSARRNVETETITVPAIALINGLPGCWAARNDQRSRFATGRWVSNHPLGVGSADIIFATQCMCAYPFETKVVSFPMVARIGWIETKQRGKLNRSDQQHQKNWASAMRRKGHFVAVCTDLAQVEDAVASCMAGGFE